MPEPRFEACARTGDYPTGQHPRLLPPGRRDADLGRPDPRSGQDAHLGRVDVHRRDRAQPGASRRYRESRRIRPGAIGRRGIAVPAGADPAPGSWMTGMTQRPGRTSGNVIRLGIEATHAEHGTWTLPCEINPGPERTGRAVIQGPALGRRRWLRDGYAAAAPCGPGGPGRRRRCRCRCRVSVLNTIRPRTQYSTLVWLCSCQS
jgi:hypothetical protein